MINGSGFDLSNGSYLPSEHWNGAIAFVRLSVVVAKKNRLIKRHRAVSSIVRLATNTFAYPPSGNQTDLLLSRGEEIRY